MSNSPHQFDHLALGLLLLTRTQVAELCQVSVDKVDEWTHRAGFPVIREGRFTRIPIEALKDWLTTQAYETNERPADPVAIARVPLRTRPTSAG